MVEDTNLKFGTDTPRESPDMTPKIFFEKVAWPGSRDPLIFWALNANSFKMVEGTGATGTPPKLGLNRGGVSST